MNWERNGPASPPPKKKEQKERTRTTINKEDMLGLAPTTWRPMREVYTHNELTDLSVTCTQVWGAQSCVSPNRTGREEKSLV